ncbi:type IV pilus biogenesis/stability protein PilW [Nocardia halotolerans]|uniref:Type IV pilus biogenesis/stability protein PilW n=1 Tax=Nocardia halotolerans TaxID=1755878 RepID=A0ABV8VP36_9NOCA
MDDPGEHVRLDQRYTGADPIDWCGAAVYPMYSEALPVGTTALHLRALSVLAPPEVSGLGLGLTVTAGHVDLGGRALGGVDIWADALGTGVDLTVTAESPEALFTLTPVWVAGSGAYQSWTGNYGMVVDLLPEGATLWCSTGPGAPDFNELVVELTTVGAPGHSAEDIGRALHELGTVMHTRGEHDSARSLWTRAAAAGHSGAAYNLGLAALRAGDTVTAQKWWQAAAHDDPRAAALLTELPQRAQRT